MADTTELINSLGYKGGRTSDYLFMKQQLINQLAIIEGVETAIFAANSKVMSVSKDDMRLAKQQTIALLEQLDKEIAEISKTKFEETEK